MSLHYTLHDRLLVHRQTVSSQLDDAQDWTNSYKVISPGFLDTVGDLITIIRFMLTDLLGSMWHH